MGPALNCADITADAVTALGDIDLLVLLIATPFISTRNRGRLPFCQRLLSSGRVELAIGSYLGLAFCRLSALRFGHIQIYILVQTQGFQKGYTRGRFIGRFPKVLDICMYFCASLLNLFHDSREKGGGWWSPSSIKIKRTHQQGAPPLRLHSKTKGGAAEPTVSL